MPVVYIPSALRPFAENQSTVNLPGETVGEILDQFVEEYPGVRSHLYEETGKIRSFVNIFVNNEDVRFLQNRDTPVTEKDEISIIPSVAGGNSEHDSPNLSHEEIQRYSRHLILPEVGVSGQKRLKASSVLMIGTGGLGSPLAMYLAAAGVGRIGLVDFDVVDASNLQRQVIHNTENIGRSKLDSAKKFIQNLNPNVLVECHETAFSAENAMQIAESYDIIIDGTDNFPTRYLVNDVSVLLGKPNVYGSIFRFEGQASVFDACKGPCYRCLYPEPPPPGMVPSCAEGGVLGVLPGIIGVIQATEAVKLILDKGDSLIGRLLLYDALAMQFREVRLRKDPKCPICGDRRTIHKLQDYQAFCGIPQAESEKAERQKRFDDFEISASSLNKMLADNSVVLLDVREPQEWEIGRIQGAVLTPLAQLKDRLGEFQNGGEIVTYCRSGERSAKALKILHEAGFNSAKHLRGGILAWSEEVDPAVPKY